MAKLFIEDCKHGLFVSTLEDGSKASGKILARAVREDGTVIARLVQYNEVSKDGALHKSGLRWLVPLSVTLSDEEESKLRDFMKAGCSIMKVMVKDITAEWKKAAEKAKSNSITDVWFDEFAVNRLMIGKPSTRKGGKRHGKGSD